MSPVVEVVHLLLAFLGKLNCQHIYWQVELGLRLVEVLFVNVVTGDSCCVSSQHNQRVIVDTESTNVMATLLSESSFVLVLEKNGTQIKRSVTLSWL